MIEDCECSGHPFTGRTDKNIEEVRKIVNED
jgi:hypothetical protein